MRPVRRLVDQQNNLISDLGAGYFPKGARHEAKTKVQRLRRRDAANLVQSCKPLVDGVVDSGLISGDHWEVLAIGKVDVVIGAKLEVQLTFRAA